MRLVAGSALALATLVATSAAGHAQEWVRACAEGQTCAIDGVRLVRYGAAGSFAYGVATNRLICSNDSFADPAPGRRKACWYQRSAEEQRSAALLTARERQIEQLRTQAQQLQGEANALQTENAALNTELDELYSDFNTLYDRLNPRQQRRLERWLERRDRRRPDPARDWPRP